MRIRILELPTEHDGDQMRTPFVLVLDRVTAHHVEIINHEHFAEGMREATGARGVLFFSAETGDVELPYEDC